MIQLLKKLRWRVLSWMTHSMALPAMRLFQQKRTFPYTLTELGAMPSTSTGATLYRFLEENKFQLLPNYESHDIKHAVLGYGGSEENEASLQYFMLGNGLRSLPVVTTILVTFFLMPEYHKSFKKAYNRGKQTAPLRGTDWFGLMPKPYNEVIKQLNLPPQ